MKKMKTYELDYQAANDIDWFLMDEYYTIAHFASAGGILPKVIIENADDNITLNTFFKEFPFKSTVQISPLLEKYEDCITEANLASFKEFTTKGILSFDKTFMSEWCRDITYHLIAFPEEYLDFESLPQEIQKILKKFQVQINFKQFNKFDSGFSPWIALFEDYDVKPLTKYKDTLKKSIWSYFLK